MPSIYYKLALLLLLIFNIKWANTVCSRYSTSTSVPKSPVDENFAILIKNNPSTYILGQEYNISLNAFNGHRYVAFSLALENERGSSLTLEDLGHFEIIDPVNTRYSPSCSNMVESTNTNPKTRSEVTWVAPTDPASGCVLIRATVLQHRDVWHMDDGGLTKRICQEIVDELESRKTVQECCACDEARYELTFQGNWNRNLHPKDFPSQNWMARFADIIGAAHTADYRFWTDGEFATEGMQEYAEYGLSRTLEKEFNENFKEGIIRTIIKARGPAFPNLNGISVASVRVDSRHHLISLASKIEPSPDWFLGISGMELCMENCTWLEERVIQLYPWDAGTDAGPSYTSADQPQKPPDVIKNIRTNLRNDPRSPFYDETGSPMYPMATLYVKRQRIYERSCEDEDSNNVDVPRECHCHPWTAWSECSTQCGEGHSYRTRVYKQPELARMYNCDATIERRQDRLCNGQNCTGQETKFENDMDLLRKPSYDPYRDLGNNNQRRKFNLAADDDGIEGGVENYDLYENNRDINNEATFQRAARRKYNNHAEDQELNRNLGFRKINEEEFIENENQPLWKNQNNEVEEINTRYSMDTENNNEIKDYEIETPDLLENKRNEFEVGNLYKGNLGTDNYRRANELQQYRQPNRIAADGLNFAINQSTMNQVENTPPMLVPAYCFHKLHMFNCLNHTVVGNFWFYNYCQDECMLFAADCCDKNENKFTSLEACEQMCQRPENEPYLRRQQQTTCSANERKHANKRKKFSNWWRN